MGRLNFVGHVVLQQEGSSAAIVHTPDETLKQLTTHEEQLLLSDAALPENFDYSKTVFGAAAALPYEAVCRCSLKSFPQFGSYGYVTQFAGQRISTIITNF